MKIFILDTVKPQFNNAGAVHRWELIRSLAKIGHDVYVIAYKNVKLNGVHTNLLQTKKGVFGKLSSRFRYVGLLFKLAMKYRFDVLYTRNGLTGAIGYVIKKLTGSKLVYELNGIPLDEWELIIRQNKISVFKRIEMALLIRIGMFALKKADAIIAVTQDIKNYLVSCGITENKIAVIGNGVNIDRFKPINNSIVLQRLREQYNIDEDDHVIMYVGNLAPWQGVEYLINAAPMILENIQKTKFLIIGDGIMRNKWEDMVEKFRMKEKFIFTGVISYKAVPDHINISDVCVSPEANDPRNERSGGSSLKLYEYMACGKSVVIGNIEGNKDVVIGSRAGFVIDPRDSEDMAKTIVKLLKNDKLRKLMGENGREATVENYSWEKIAEQVVKVCKSISRK